MIELTVEWDGTPTPWWGTAKFTLTNNTSATLDDPLIEFTVQTRQQLAKDRGLDYQRPDGSNHVKARLEQWLPHKVEAGHSVEFTVGIGPADQQPGIGSLPGDLKVNGQGVDSRGGPDAPTGLRVVRTGRDSIVIAWDAVTTYPPGVRDYWVSYSREGGEPQGGWTGGRTDLTASGLFSDTDYRFTVWAMGSDDRTGRIAAITARTLGNERPPPPPAGFPRNAPFVDAAAWPTPRLGKIVTGADVNGLFLGFLAPRQVDGRTRATWAGLGSTWDKYEPIPDSECRPGPNDGRTHSSVAAESGYLKWLIQPLQQRGTKFVISVGGASAHPIEEADDLTAADAAQEYLAVLDNYGTNLIDFDVEGSALGTDAYRRKHADVLAEIRRLRPEVRISHTLPVDRDGWNPSTIALMTVLAGSDYKPDLLMGMLMEMRGSEDYWQITRMSAEAMVEQTAATFGWTTAQAWSRFGACPMYGQNWNKRVFTVEHMRSLVAFAQEKNIAVVSGWDATRDYNQVNPDRACEDTPDCPPQPGEGSLNTCTRTPQDHLQFSRLAASYNGPRAPRTGAADDEQAAPIGPDAESGPAAESGAHPADPGGPPAPHGLLVVPLGLGPVPHRDGYLARVSWNPVAYSGGMRDYWVAYRDGKSPLRVGAWSGGRTELVVKRLLPGPYRFYVQAVGNDGKWGAEASYDLTIVGKFPDEDADAGTPLPVAPVHDDGRDPAGLGPHDPQAGDLPSETASAGAGDAALPLPTPGCDDVTVTVNVTVDGKSCR
ncbi:hypothetical protein [Saccharothrix sp. HUAS TT1]|uniref:hypothetical protein n=1 Tax=unclassified Saccharothrix TaxID=2593673 RepID=UPI00345BB946